LDILFGAIQDHIDDVNTVLGVRHTHSANDTTGMFVNKLIDFSPES